MKTSLYDKVNSRLTRNQNSGYKYEGKIFERTLSPYILMDDNRKGILSSYEKMIFFVIEKTKYIKTFFNYTVPKDYKGLN